MNKRRLLKLADLLEADAKNRKGLKFDLETWGIADDPAKPISCGTTACAMGLAVASRAFVRAGLLPPEPYDEDGVERLDLNPIMESGAEGFDAAAELFGISDHDAGWLFNSDFYDDLPTEGSKGERAVANRIRDFVAGKDRPS